MQITTYYFNNNNENNMYKFLIKKYLILDEIIDLIIKEIDKIGDLFFEK